MLRPFIGLVPTTDVVARSVAGSARGAQRLARRRSHPRHVAWLEGADDGRTADVDEWLADGSLTADDAPRLRVLEQCLPDGRRVVGVLGLARLADLVPHEGTDPSAVRRRVARDRRQQVDARPLLAVLPADPPDVTRVVDRTLRGEPELDVLDGDGLRHRTFVVGDDDVEDLTAALAHVPCLLADGHHRAAAAATMGRHEVPALVTLANHPPVMLPVWRLAAVPRDHQAAAAAFVASFGDSGPVTVQHGAVRRCVQTDGVELPVEATQRIADAVPGVQRTTSTADPTAMTVAIRDGAVVVGSAAPSVTDVLGAIAAGRPLPPKSTAFHPKPRVGLVLHRIPD